jgi:hypothetical protein
VETLTYSSGRASGCDSPGLLNSDGDMNMRFKGFRKVVIAIVGGGLAFAPGVRAQQTAQHADQPANLQAQLESARKTLQDWPALSR